MDIEYHVIEIIFGVLLIVLGWFSRTLWGAVKELTTDLAKLREELPKEYVAKDDFKDGIDHIEKMVNRIFEKLDDKADK